MYWVLGHGTHPGGARCPHLTEQNIHLANFTIQRLLLPYFQRQSLFLDYKLTKRPTIIAHLQQISLLIVQPYSSFVLRDPGSCPLSYASLQTIVKLDK